MFMSVNITNKVQLLERKQITLALTVTFAVLQQQ